MITTKQKKRALRFAKDVLEQNYTEEQIHRMTSMMKKSYREIQPHVPRFKSSFNKTLIKISIDTLAFYKAILTELNKDDSLKLIELFVNRWMDGQFDSWMARKIYANRFLHRLYRRLWFARTNKANDSEGQKFEYIRPSGNLFYGVNVVKCGHVNFLKKMNASELAPSMCKADFYIQKYLPKGITFKRSQVIAEGASYCDFRYLIENKHLETKKKI